MLRRTPELDLYLVRHAEAYKNLLGVHGGGDQRLTPRGEVQAQMLGEYFLSHTLSNPNSLQIVHQPEGRSKATAQHIGRAASKATVECSELNGVGLGLAGGLSKEELARQYPEVAQALAAWRNNTGSLHSRPKVPGSEPMDQFAERIHQGLLSSIDSAADSLAIIGTTSTLNMINHLLTNDGSFCRSRYNFIHFPLGGITTWQISSEAPIQTTPITTLPA